MFELTGKTAIVTGATKGIGYSMAVEMANAGANIVVVSRHQNDCDAVARELEASSGVKTLAKACDVSKPEMIADLVKSTVDKFGAIDVLVNNAGVAITKPATDITEEDWDKILDINLKGVFMLSQAVGKQMISQEHGRIINISSALGMIATKNVLPYLCSKGGVIQMTKGLALEWARYNITVNAVCPGYVVTPINEEEISDERVKQSLLRKIPMRRFGTTTEVASLVVYLASDAASYITGAAYTVDGGWTAE